MPEHKDRFEAFMLRVKPTLKPARKEWIAVRPVPRFLRVEDYREGTAFSITVPAVRRTWWLFGCLAVITAWVFFVPIIAAWSIGGWYTDGRGNFYGGGFSYSSFLFGIAVLLGLTWLAWLWLFPRIRISADPENITVHDRIYDWKRAEGFRIGYSIGGVERSERQPPFRGFRMAYGPWGDDIPYLLPEFLAPAYIMFLNEALEGVQPRSSYNQAGETGIKPVLF